MSILAEADNTSLNDSHVYAIAGNQINTTNYYNEARGPRNDDVGTAPCQKRRILGWRSPPTFSTSLALVVLSVAVLALSFILYRWTNKFWIAIPGDGNHGILGLDVLPPSSTKNEATPDDRPHLELPQPEHEDFQFSPLLTLPPSPLIFHGRDELVDHVVGTILESMASNDSASIAILGGPGMGKTSVALAVVNHPSTVAAFGDALYWIPCDRKNTIPLLLNYLSQIFSIMTTGSITLGDIVSCLREDHLPRVFLLDNLETLWDSFETKSECEAILTSLSSFPHITILVTMRGIIPPHGVRWIWLPPLEPPSLEAARQIFIARGPPHVDDKLDDLLLEVDCVPLAVYLLATVAWTGITPSELLEKWKTDGVRLLTIDHEDRYTLRLRSVEFSIFLSLQSTPMVSDPGALPLLIILAYLPGGIRQEYLQSIAQDIQDANAAERTLLRTALGYRGPDRRLQVLSPIRSYVLQHYTLDVNHKSALRSFYFSLCEYGGRNPGMEGFTEAFQKLSLEESNTRSVILDALEDGITADAVRGAINCSNYLYWNVASVDLLEKAIDAIQVHPTHELDALLPLCQLNLGRLLARLDRYHPAIIVLRQAAEAFQAFDDWRNVAHSYERLSNVQRLLRLHNESIESAIRAENIFRMIGDRAGVSKSLQCRSRVYDEQGKAENSLALLNEAEGICKTMEDRTCVSKCRRLRGITLARQGKHDEAVAELGKAQAYFLAFGSRFDVAIGLYNLGFALYLRGDYDEADSALKRSYELFKDLGNVGAMAWCLYRQGELERRRGRFEEAIRVSQRACHEFEKMETVFWFAICLANQARSFAALDRQETARQLLQEAWCAIEMHESSVEFLKTFREDMEVLQVVSAGKATKYCTFNSGTRHPVAYLPLAAEHAYKG